MRNETQKFIAFYKFSVTVIRLINTGIAFNGKHSDQLGVSVVRVNKGLPSRKYMGGKQILEEHPNNALMPYFFGVKHKPFSFKVTLCCEDEDMDKDKLYEIAQWLCVNEYKPFVSDDDVTKIYYCMPITESDFMTNGLDDGYFEVEFRCRDGFAWMQPTYVTHNLATITSPTTIQIKNYTNVLKYYEPEMQITLADTNTAVELVNLSDGGYTFSFTDLSVGEVLTIDNQKRKLTSDTADNRFDKFNRNWFRLKQGVNNIQVTGKCTIIFRMQFPIFN
jgi:predicted phage tail component-like protein